MMQYNAMSENSVYYVYRHINLDNQEIFYIGKGKGDRYKSMSGRSKFWQRYINKNQNWCSEIIYSNLSEDNAFDLECKEIDRIGRRVARTGTLVNILPGGRGFPESYLIYRDELERQMSDTYYLDKQEAEKEKRIELFKLIEKAMANSKDRNNDPISMAGEYLRDIGYLPKPKYNWKDLTEEQRLNVILEEHNVFIHNFKVSHKWAASIKEVKLVSDLDHKFINKMYNIKERYEKD